MTVPPSPASLQAATAEEILNALDVARRKAEFALQKRDLLGVGLRAELNRLWGTITARLGILEMRVKANSMNDVELDLIGRFLRDAPALREPRKTTVHDAWAFHDELELLRIETADVDDVAVLLSQEVELDTSGHAGQRVDSDSWRHFLEPEVLHLLNRPFAAYLTSVPGSPERQEAETRAQKALATTKPALIHVYEEHATAGRVWRQRTETRKRNLSSAMIVLAPIVTALAILMVVGSSLSAADVFITALAGALAGTLARMYKLRDVFSITKMRGLYADFFVQPFVGATIALFVLGLLFSGIVELPGQSPLSWPTYATYGFVAAFSEPFFLKLVGRVGEVGDPTS